MGVIAAVAAATAVTAACCQGRGHASSIRVTRVRARTERMTEISSQVSESVVVMGA